VCNADRLGALAYTAVPAGFHACAAAGWTVVEVKGEKGDKGDAGATGATGAQGEKGADGSDNRIVESINCTGDLGTTSIDYRFHTAKTAAGDVFVTASIRTLGDQIADSKFYSASQAGAQTASALVRYDLVGNDNNGFWEFTLNRATTALTITYSDGDLSDGEDIFAQPASECTKQTF
jgi:hypothetical protein